MEKLPTKTFKRREIIAALLIFTASFLLFFNTISFGFFSDDFFVIHRLTIVKQFWAPGFFRPVSDLSLLLNYKMEGLDASTFRITNIALHSLNGILLFKIILNLEYFDDKTNFRLAGFAAFLFVVYPFHGESISWIVGRGSILACNFGLLSILIFTYSFNKLFKYTLACILYFISLAAYESVIVLPLIFFIAEYFKDRNFKTAVKLSLPFLSVLIVQLIIKRLISGVTFGNYGIDMFNENAVGYLMRYAKSMGRLAIPGMQNSMNFSILLVLFLMLVIAAFLLVFKYYREHFYAFIALGAMLLSSQLVPGIFGVDTHNQDGDRLLYFPSIFFCTALSFFIVIASGKIKTLPVLAVIIALLCLPELFSINRNWMIADNGIKKIISVIRRESIKNDTLVIANIPQLYKGSYMFRNGFKEALELSQIRTEKISVINYLSKEDLFNHPGLIQPIRNGQTVEIYPQIVIIGNVLHYKTDTEPFTKSIQLNNNNRLYYWNNETLVPFF